jgi:hypothetical protein
MSANEAARKFLQWATHTGLVSEGAVLPPFGAPVPVVQPKITSEGMNILRKRLIRYVGANEEINAIYVFLRRASPSAKELTNLPGEYEGSQLLYRQGNPQGIDGVPAQPHTATQVVIHQAQGSHYFACGSSISIGNECSAGTLGALCSDQQGALFGLSNCHVVGGTGQAPLHIPIIGPGVVDVSPMNIDPVHLGRLDRTGTIACGDLSQVDHTQNLDCAAFRIGNPALVSSMQGNVYDTPTMTRQITPGMVVEKFGRTTGHTVGMVICEVVGALPISVANVYYGFSGKAYFEPVYQVQGLQGSFSEAGDSGSLVVFTDPADNQRYAVGLVFAGAQDPTALGGVSSYVLPIEPVLARLGLSLASGHNI